MKPILFNTEMVRAILAGRKTETRRVVKFPEGMTGRLPTNANDHLFYPCGIKYPPYKKGDILYVRETWTTTPNGQDYLYKADSDTDGAFIRDKRGALNCPRWHPSIHMPKEAARIFLRVTDVRAERLRDITEADAVKEGLYKGWRLSGRGSLALSARQAFMWLWETVTRDGPAYKTWACNPWVWVIEFEMLAPNPQIPRD